jgi:DNA-binding XRE family transcriptional regulator
MLTGFQLRAAKSLLEYTFRDIANVIGVHENTLVRFANTQNLQYIRGVSHNIIMIKDFFEQKNILFPREHTISLKRDNDFLQSNNTNLTRFQLKASRIATGLTQDELSHYTKLSSSSISLLEHKNNMEYIESSKIQIPVLRRFFEHLGITFPDDLTVTLIKDPKILVKKNKNSS